MLFRNGLPRSVADSYYATNRRSALEFGCGGARVLRHFRNIGDLSLARSDANPKPIEWARQNLPGIDFRTNVLEPPLAFADDIPLAWPRPWLEELRRVLRPGGYLLCTVLGSWCAHQRLSPQDQAKLARAGALTLDANHPRASYSTQVLGSWDVYQTRDQVREVFGAVFTILGHTDRAVGQDMLALHRPRRAPA
jgi:SAM-dependent methyltransferase